MIFLECFAFGNLFNFPQIFYTGLRHFIPNIRKIGLMKYCCLSLFLILKFPHFLSQLGVESLKLITLTFSVIQLVDISNVQ